MRPCVRPKKHHECPTCMSNEDVATEGLGAPHVKVEAVENVKHLPQDQVQDMHSGANC